MRCPWHARYRLRRLARIKTLIATLPADQVAVYEDEADIHLNPKIGRDWMPRGFQRRVLTPGKNEKAYVAGTLDAHNGTVLWTGEQTKNSALFVSMMRTLANHYTWARKIHVILDNCKIHKSAATAEALRDMPRISPEFLPPYCPDDNRIERMWQDLHANVTRNHNHPTLPALCGHVATWLSSASPWPPSRFPVSPVAGR